MKKAKKITGALLGVALTATAAFGADMAEKNESKANTTQSGCGSKNDPGACGANNNNVMPMDKKAATSGCGASKEGNASCGAKAPTSSCGASK